MSQTPFTLPASAREVLDAWLLAGEALWFVTNDAFDDLLRRRFRQTWEDAACGRLSAWEDTAEGALALILVLDQFPRNMFRGAPDAFATDALARAAARRALARGFDHVVAPALKVFFYLPFEHSEMLHDQDRCVSLCATLTSDKQLHYAHLHREIIARFGRFPHRNAVLGRLSTPEEQAFLAEGGFSG